MQNIQIHYLCTFPGSVFLLIQAPNVTNSKASFPTFKVLALGYIFTMSVVWQR